MGMLKPFNTGPVTMRSMPFWCVANPLGDPFGERVLPAITSIETCQIICKAAKAGLIELTSAHDDDLVPWNPEKPEDDLDKKSETYKILRKIKQMLDEAGVRRHTITCNLHSNPIFRNGGLTNPDPKIRELARQKVERTLRIGHFLGFTWFTYWVARDGWEVAIITPWKEIYQWIAEGLNHVVDYIKKNNFTNYQGGTIEPKPNEPRAHMFLPTAGHGVGFIMTLLRDPDFWKINPELTQHEGMTLLDAVTTVAYLVSTGKLGFLHFGNQVKGEFDDDLLPLTGPEGLKETVYMFWVLEQMSWKGVVEFDCHMLRTEADPADPLNCRLQFVENCSYALSLALELASRLKGLDVGKLSHSWADILATAKMCNIAPIGIQLAAAKKE